MKLARKAHPPGDMHHSPVRSLATRNRRLRRTNANPLAPAMATTTADAPKADPLAPRPPSELRSTWPRAIEVDGDATTTTGSSPVAMEPTGPSPASEEDSGGRGVDDRAGFDERSATVVAVEAGGDGAAGDERVVVGGVLSPHSPPVMRCGAWPGIGAGTGYTRRR